MDKCPNCQQMKEEIINLTAQIRWVKRQLIAMQEASMVKVSMSMRTNKPCFIANIREMKSYARNFSNKIWPSGG